MYGPLIVEIQRWAAIFEETAAAVTEAVHALEDRRPDGERPGQYALDLVADAAALEVLRPTGATILSEESGVTEGGDLTVVIDPIDGSTNCSREIPYYAISLCLFDGDGPAFGMVKNLATGQRYHAVRGGGAFLDDVPLRPSGHDRLVGSMVAMSGWPGRELPWRQFRALGSGALSICEVAAGHLDAFFDGGRHHYIWDYAGAVLVCHEAGAVVGERNGEELTVLDGTVRRAPVAAATAPLLAELLDALGPV